MSKLDMALGDFPRGRGGSSRRRGGGGGGDGGSDSGSMNPLSRDNDLDVQSGADSGPVRRERQRSRGTPYARPSRADGDWVRGGGGRSSSGGSFAPKIITTTSSKVMVTNLDGEVTKENLQEIFEEAGALKSCTLKTDSSGRSMGTAEIAFVKKADAAQCVKDFDGAEVDGRPMYLRLLEAAGPVVKRVTPAQRPTSRPRMEPQVYRPGQGGGGKAALFGTSMGQFGNRNFGSSSFGSGRNGGRSQRRGNVGSAKPARGRSGRGGGGARGRGGRGGGGRGKEKEPTADELDAEMDSYFSAAKGEAE